MIKVKILDDDCRFPHPGRRANSRNVRSRRALSGVKEFHNEVEEEEEAFLSQEVVDRGREWFFEKDNRQGILGSAMERRPVGGVVVARESSVKLTAERQNSEMSYGRRSKSGVTKVSPSCARNEEAGETASLELEPQPKQLASVEGGSRKAVANPYQLKRRRMLVDSDDGDYADPFEGKEEEKDTPDVGDVTGNRKGVGIRAKSNGGLPSEQYSTGLGNKQVNGQLIKQEITTGVKRHGNVVTKISTTQSFDSPKKREKITRNLNVGVGVRNSRSHETVNGHFDHAGCETDKKKVRGQGSNLVMGHGSNGSGRLLKIGLPDRLCVSGKLTNETHCMHKDGSLEHLGRSEVELNRAKLQCCEVESNGFNSSKLQLEKTGNGLREIIEAEKGTKQSSLLKDREISTSTSMKHLIAAAQAKRQARTLAVSSVPLNLEVGRLGSTNLSNLSPPRSQLRASPIQGTHSDLSQENERLTDGYTQSLRIPVDTAQHSGVNLWAERQTSPYQPVQGEMLLSEDTEVSVARDALQGMLETLSGTKDCIARVTRHALECVKFGIAEQVIQLIVKKLETEPSFGHRVDIFFLVDSITQCSYQTKGAAALSYIPAVQMMLPRLLDAAAPPGPSAKENRRQCLRVLKIWLDRSIMPEKALKDFIHRLESQRDEAIDEGVLSHCPPSECALNRPIYKIEGVFVDEYGSNAHCSGPGLSLSWLCDDEEKLFKEKREEKETSWTDAGHRGTDKYRHILQAVDGELEMEDECPNLDGIEYGWNSYEKAQVTPEDSLCATHVEVDDLPLLPFEPCPPKSPPPLPPPLPSSPPPSPPPLPPSPPPLLLPSPPPPDTMVFAIPVPSCDAYPLCNPLQSTELPFQSERESANHTDMPILGSPPESLSTAIEEKLSHPHLPSYNGNQAMKLSSTYSSSPGLRGNPLPLGIAITPSHYYPVMTQMPLIAHPLPSSSAYRPSHAFRNPQASFQKGKPSSSKERWHIS